MGNRTKVGLLGLVIIGLFAIVWHVNELDAQRQVQQLIAKRAQELELLKAQQPSNLLFAPNSKAHHKLMRLGYDARFKTVAIEGQGGLWYLHQDWTQLPLSRNTLSAQVSENGELTLVSHYTGGEYLAHSQVFVKIGNVIYDSTFVPNYTHELVDNTELADQVYEMNSYSSQKDIDIIRHIAMAPNKDIKVLIKGHDDVIFELDENDKQAILDCYQLAQRIQAG